MRDRRRSALILLVVIAAGILSRAVVHHGPIWLRKDPGDILWGAAVYWLAATAFIRLKPSAISLTAIVYGLATETFKLVQSPGLQHLRQTLFGHLVLGQIFSWRDIFCYIIGIAVSAVVDSYSYTMRDNAVAAKIPGK